MTCSRIWQVEAIRDGRLSGKDLELAERHREHCLECAEAARRAAALTHGMANLPELPRDPLAVRRSRQRLLSAVNDSLLASPSMTDSPSRRAGPWVAVLLVLPTAVLAHAFFAWQRSPGTPSPTFPKSVVDVRAKAGTRWVAHNSAGLEQVELGDGEASFKVRPHPDRRVLIRLPDGELEDLGTTFEVAVHDQHTSHIAVSEGRVAVRLSSQPEFALSAGEHWDLGLAASAPPSAAADSSAPSTSAPPAPHSEAARQWSGPSRALGLSTATAGVPLPAPPPSATSDIDSTRAEDATYLAVVSLLRAGRYSEARTQAKAYLLRFPNGFRRVEMLNVATGSD